MKFFGKRFSVSGETHAAGNILTLPTRATLAGIRGPRMRPIAVQWFTRFSAAIAHSYPPTSAGGLTGTAAGGAVQPASCSAASKLRPSDPCHGVPEDATHDQQVRADQALRGMLLVRDSFRLRCKRSALPLS
jgi:hypothetical protein